MLDFKNNIGFEWYKNGKRRARLWLFNCLSCQRTIKVKISQLQKHTGNCISCSSRLTIKIAQEFNRMRPFEARYNILVQKTKHEKSFNIKYEDYLEYTKIDKCHYCERFMNWKPHDNNPGFWLDRKDNSKEHTVDNVVVCCGDCNKTKRDYFSYEEFVKLSPILKEIRINRGS